MVTINSRMISITPVAVFVIMLFFAANSVITRFLVQGGLVAPFPLTIIRFLSGLAMLILIATATPKTFQKSKPSSGHIWGGLFLGAYAFAISYGYVYISAAAGALIFYSFVVLSMSTYSVAHDKEALTFKLALGQVLGILGVLTITFSRIGSVSLLGVLLMAATGTSWGLYSVYGRRFENAFDYTYNSFFVLGLISLALAAISLPLLGVSQWSTISLTNLLLALYLGMISTALSYILWNRILRKLKSSQGGLAQLIVPILTAVMGVFLLAEVITPTLLLGGALILIGIYVNGLR